MGKQVNFYMTLSDEDEFVDSLRSHNNVVIFMEVQPLDKIAFLEDLPAPDTPGWFALCLWHRGISPPPKLKYISQQGYYAVNKSNSEVIEFDRSTMHEGRLVRGRIWAEMAIWNEDGTLVYKSDDFRKWYNRLANWIKRHSVRDRYGDYVLPGAAEYSKQGGRLVQAVFAKHVKLFHHEVDERGSGKPSESEDADRNQ
jgi:hypothetical protein